MNTTRLDDVTQQLVDELGDRARAVANCLSGIDLLQIDRAVEASAVQLAEQLAQDTDDQLAAQTVIDLMCALWPAGDPATCGQPEWWRTPVGRLCARSLGTDTETVTRAVAAAMLGVHPGTVAQMVARGTLDRGDDGGVRVGSVLERLARSS